ncbi:MAG: type I restriction enzyme HsdR N-terminal domain-containing protein, partial [Chloroflexi bacterium]|nr:type I restriction enzyme HsdR N-terminal domain-containing protein [Chloroflexota bacterium]
MPKGIIMELVERLHEFAAKAAARIPLLKTEEASKTALVMPFLREVLGYDPNDPAEVVPEFTADYGVKQGEKVDFAIMRDGRPVILIECKQLGAPLSNHASQLFRYFGVTDAQFGILTDGA